METVSRDAEIDQLTAAGYRRISGKHGIIARIDRPDWIEFLYQRHPNWRPRERVTKKGRVIHEPGLPLASMADDYRRVYSKDKLTVDPEIARWIPSSTHNGTGYVEI